MSALAHHVPIQRAYRLCNAASPGIDGAEVLRRLVRRIADDDHDAFAELFDRVSGPVSFSLHREVHNPHRVAAVVAGTFVEVWWLAGGHVDLDTDVMAWIQAIVRRRVADSRAPAPLTADSGVPTPQEFTALWTQRVESELAGLLGRHRGPRHLPK